MNRQPLDLVSTYYPYGLLQDVSILKESFEQIGCDVRCFDDKDRSLWDVLRFRKQSQTIVHVAQIQRRWLNAGRKHILIPNQESFRQDRAWALRFFDKILVKSQHSQACFSGIHPDIVYTGFTSKDIFIGGHEKDWTSFFHVSTDFIRKGTQEIVRLWQRHPEWPQLVLKVTRRDHLDAVGPNMTVIDGYLPYEQLVELQNRYGLHLCPSRSEGWGHTLVEAMSSGALVVTTDAPPMNEIVTPETGRLVPYKDTMPRRLGTDFLVDLNALERTISELVDMSTEAKQALGQSARERYFLLDRVFRQRLAAVFTSADS